MKLTCKRRVVSSSRLCNDGSSQESRFAAIVGSLFSHHPIINLVQMLP